MLRKLFLFCTSLAAAAVGVFLWKKRDELEAEIERIRGERRAGLRSAPSARHGAPAVNGSGGRLDGASQAAARPARKAPAPRRGPARVTPGDTGAAAGESAAESRCQARTRSGKRCTRPAEPGSDHCWQHEPS